MQKEQGGYMARWMVKSTPLQAYHQVIFAAHPIQTKTYGTHEIWVVCGGNQKAQSNV